MLLFSRRNQVEFSSLIPPIEIVQVTPKRKGAKILCLAWHNSRDPCQFVLSRNQSEFWFKPNTHSSRPARRDLLCRSVVSKLLDSTQYRVANIVAGRTCLGALLVRFDPVGTFFLFSFAPRSGRRLPWRKASIWRVLRSKNSRHHL
jgi:hypothetical protein